jgi:hypothetical protein
MAAKPILFSGPMVRALLAGTKTQTRRQLTTDVHYTEWLASETIEDMELRGYSSFDDAAGNCFMANPRINWGDHLYVRETWRCNGWANDVATIMYRASEGDGYTAMTEQFPVAGKTAQRVTGTWHPGIHMPRWASRLTLHVTEVRVQPLQDISLADCLAEGCPIDPDYRDTTADKSSPPMVLTGPAQWITPRGWYHQLWDDINGAGAWDRNPWVAAYTFTVEQANIDHARAAA